jgi:hypothetical protein
MPRNPFCPVMSNLPQTIFELAASFAPTLSANVENGGETLSTRALTADLWPLHRLQSLRRWSKPIGIDEG